MMRVNQLSIQYFCVVFGPLLVKNGMLSRPGGKEPCWSWYACRARPICLRLLAHFRRLAASRTFWTAGNSRPMSTLMTAMTTSSSTSVKAGRRFISESRMGAGERRPGYGKQRPVGVEGAERAWGGGSDERHLRGAGAFLPGGASRPGHRPRLGAWPGGGAHRAPGVGALR